MKILVCYDIKKHPLPSPPFPFLRYPYPYQHTTSPLSIHSSLGGTMNDPLNGQDGNNKVKKLFCYFSDELVQGRAVTSMGWNSVSPTVSI